jgi:hypothetical protein
MVPISSAKAEPAASLRSPATRTEASSAPSAETPITGLAPLEGEHRPGAHPRIVGIEHQGRTVLEHVEESSLGAHVFLGRAVEIEVLVGDEIGEDPEREGEPGDPSLGDPVGGDFHRRHLHPRVRHGAEGTVDRRRIGGRHPGVHHAVPDPDAERADDADGKTAGGEGGLDQQGGGRLAEGTGDSQQPELPGGIPEERGGQERGGPARVGDDDREEAGDRGDGTGRDRACTTRVGHEAGSVVAGTALHHEQVAGAEVTGVDRDPAHLDVGADQVGIEGTSQLGGGHWHDGI